MDSTLTLMLQSILGESIFGVPVTTLSVGAFICGVALLYLVMQRQLRRKPETPVE